MHTLKTLPLFVILLQICSEIFHRFLTREGWMTHEFHRLVASKGRFDTPYALIEQDGEFKPVAIISAPTFPGGMWTLSGGQKVTTAQIRKIVTSFDLRIEAGYC
jgi:hypothetical protein